MVAIDRWALWRTQQLQDEVIAAYRNYQFHLIYQKVHNFCSVDLGGFYLDVLKDRLYTTPAKSHARRSAQTAMFWIAEAMVRWLAPILSFTAEEIWRFMPGDARRVGVLRDLGAAAARRGHAAARSIGMRSGAAQRRVARTREAAQCGAIGAPLDAEVDLYCAPPLLRDARSVRRRAALRVHHLGRARAPGGAAPAGCCGGRRRTMRNAAWIVGAPDAATEMRSLLAQARGRRHACRTSGAVRPLRDQYRRARRSSGSYT